MFYCQSCAVPRNWPTDDYLPISFGKCEVCDLTNTCFDVPSRNLPVPDHVELAIESIKDSLRKRDSK